MRNLYIDPLQLLSTAYTAGEITIEQINSALETPRGLNMPCGFTYNEHRQGFAVFFSTDKDSGKVNKSKKGHIKLNFQPHDKPKPRQEAATPGQVLGSTQGAPVLTPEVQAAIVVLQAATAAKIGVQPEVVQDEAPKDETDFSDLNEVDEDTIPL